jgi:hypothetical protein
VQCSLKQHVDHQTHHDWEDNRNKDFGKQISTFTDAYMEWDLHCADESSPPPQQEAAGCYGIMASVLLMYSVSILPCMMPASLTIASPGSHIEHLNVLSTDIFIGCTLICHGLIPSTPSKPSMTITIRTLELYHLAHFCCPQSLHISLC